MIWPAIIYWVVATLITIALSPKPPKPKPASITDFDVPTAEEDRAIPVLFGRVLVSGPNVVGYGGLSNSKIKQSSLFSSTTIGYRYYLSMHFMFGYGPWNALCRIVVGDLTAWSGNITANGEGTIDKQELFGGKKSEGGLLGKFDVTFGLEDQAPSTYLTTLYGHTVPAYRKMMGLIWKVGTMPGPLKAFGQTSTIQSGYIGNSQYLKNWAFEGWRTTAGWWNDTPWYPEKATVGDAGAETMNAAHIIYECQTNPEWGEGQPASVFDDTLMREAADQLYDEGVGLAMLWNNSDTIQGFVTTILEHVAGTLAFDRRTNKRFLKLIRGDYDIDELEEFGPEDIELTSFQRRAWGDTVNELTLMWTDPATNQATPIILQDLGNIRAQQRRVPEKISREGFRTYAAAKACAARELAARSIPLATIEFTANRRFWRYTRGDVVKIRWPNEGLAGVVFRLLDIKGGSLEDGKITVSAVEDVYARSGMEYTVIAPTGGAAEPPDLEEPSDATGPTVISSTQGLPPTDPDDGDTYIVPQGAGDIWAPFAGKVVTWDEAGQEWLASDVPEGVLIYDQDAKGYVRLKDGILGAPTFYASTIAARNVTYDDSLTGLGADNVEDAIQALVARSSEGLSPTVSAYANGLYYAQAFGSDPFDSPDGLDWTAQASLGQQSLDELLWIGGRYVAVKTNSIGRSDTSDIYGSWTWQDFSGGSGAVVLPLHGFSGFPGGTHFSVRAVNERLVAWVKDQSFGLFTPDAGPVFLTSDDGGATWDELSPAHGFVDQYFLVRDVVWDDGAGRYLVFGDYLEVQPFVDPLTGAPSFKGKPQVWTTTDLESFAFLADLHPSPGSSEDCYLVSVHPVAARQSRDLVPPAVRFELRRPQTQSSDIDYQWQYSGVGVYPSGYKFRDTAESSPRDVFVFNDNFSTGSIRRVPAGAFSFADQIDGSGIPTGGGPGGNAVRRAYQYGDSIVTMAGGIVRLWDLTIGLAAQSISQPQYIGDVSNLVFDCAQDPDKSQLWVLLQNTNAIDWYLQELDPADLTEIGGRVAMPALSSIGGSFTVDATHAYFSGQALGGLPRMIKVALTGGSPVWDSTFGSTDHYHHYDAQVRNGYVYLYVHGTGPISADGTTIWRLDATTGAQDLGFEIPRVLGGGWAWETYEPGWLIFGQRIAIDTEATGGPVIVRSSLLGATVYQEQAGANTILARSEDGGDTWTFPSPGFPDRSINDYGARIYYDGERFLFAGRGWTGISEELVAFEYSDADSSVSGHPETAWLSVFTHGDDGQSAGGMSGPSGGLGTIATSDGLHWAQGEPPPLANADEVALAPVVGMTASNLQEAVEELFSLIGNPEAIDVLYENSTGGLTAENVQAAIDELLAELQAIIAMIGAPSGIAPLDSSSKVPIANLPALALTDVSVVATQVAQLALTAEEGDVAIRTDLSKSYVHNGGTAGTMADWSELLTPTDLVLSVAGRVGAITLTTADLTDAGAANGAATLDSGARLNLGQVPLVLNVTEASTARTLGATEYFKVVEFTSGSAVVYTVPTNTTLAVPIGTVVGGYQSGAGAVTITPAGGVTVYVRSTKQRVSSGQGAFFALRKVQTNEWELTGDLLDL
jgi:hypothetical protein